MNNPIDYQSAQGMLPVDGTFTNQPYYLGSNRRLQQQAQQMAEYTPIDYGRIQAIGENYNGQVIDYRPNNPNISYNDISQMDSMGFRLQDSNNDDDLRMAQIYARKSAEGSYNSLPAHGSGINYNKLKASDNNKPVQNLIVQVANKHGIDPSIALAMGQIESNFRNVKSSHSSAKGIYQFIDSTAKQYGIYGRQMDVHANIDAGMRLFKDNSRAFMKAFGRMPTAGEIYLYHQQGAGGGKALLTNPNKKAVDVIGKERVIKNGGNVNMTAGEFANMWIAKGNALQEQFKRKLG